MIIQAIPIDVVEIIVVSSKDYNLFMELQKVLFKLQQPERISRINDKLTKLKTFENLNEYILNNKTHREYNKPAIIWSNGSMQYYLNNNRSRNNGCPTGLDSVYSRHWRKYNLEHRDNDLPREIYINGSQDWKINGDYFRENNKPCNININGNRYYKNSGIITITVVFDYLDN